MTFSGAAPLTVPPEFYGTLLNGNDVPQHVQLAPPVLHFVRPADPPVMNRLTEACSNAYLERPAIGGICQALTREAARMSLKAMIRITTVQANGLHSFNHRPVFLALVLIDLAPA